MKDKIKRRMLFAIISYLFSFSIIMNVLFYYEIDFKFINLAAVVFVIIVLISILFYDEKICLLEMVIFDLFVLYLIIERQFSLNIIINSQKYDYISSFLKWLLKYLAFPLLNKEPLLFFHNQVILFFSVVICSIVYFINIIFKNIILTILICVSSYIVFWQLEKTVFLPAFFLFLTSSLISYIVFIYIKSGGAKQLKLFLYVLPFISLLVLTIMCLPKPHKPLIIPWLDNIIFNSNDEEGDFSLNQVGFGENDKLGGDIDISYKPVLEVDSKQRTYLKGTVYDNYTGFSWVNTQKEKLKDYTNNNKNYFIIPFVIEVNQTKEAVNKAENTKKTKLGLYLSSLINSAKLPETKKIDVKIKYLNINTRTVFIPKDIQQLDCNNITNLKIDPSGAVSSTNNLKKYFSYEAKGINIEQRNKKVKTILTNTDGMSKNEIERLGIKQSIEKNEKIEIYYELYDNLDLNKYLQLPSNISDRVKQFAKEIVGQENNPYKKAKLLEEKLASTYEYTLKPGKVPEGLEFVDNFLFNQQKGYCTYFATSLCILLRCEGIPARYVEGFVLPKEKNEQGKYIVLAENAHAWVEVYINGYWIQLEPTPKYRGILYPVRIEGNRGYKNYSIEDIIEQYGLDKHNDIVRFSIKDEEKVNDKNLILNKLFFILSVVFCCLVLIILYNVIRVLSRNKRYSKKDKYTAICYYNLLINLLELAGVAQKASETPLQFSKRIDNIYSFRCSFRYITIKYYEALYGQKHLSGKEKEDMMDIYKMYEGIIKRDISFIKLFINRYILPKI